ncbi:urease accessory protein UreE [Gloeocapsa sp. PCC 73106]|uniref:urease accessory protein UreE n=1 Tax=Gloeocapsa sp. PCC 73106 TaxID=102232 RepID=UPI0002ACB19A|nr:urease accessory protein UreE [Gloeocapsa sp. PCC 73106]ELR97967.1 urease accessory protein UreE [Gloeocapsa sp. PCC 73106]
MLIFKQKTPKTTQISPQFTLYLSAAERLKTQQRIALEDRPPIYLRLNRGEIIEDGDILLSETGEIAIAIAAKPEPVMTVTAHYTLDLLKAAYHLGNRHVPLEIKPDYLRFPPDSVLASLLTQLGLTVQLETAPFYPESGAYQHKHE